MNRIIPPVYLPLDEAFMRRALREAEKALEHNDVPIGAVVVKDEQVIGVGHNERELLQDPTAHAEVLALRRGAAAAGNYRLPATTLYVTVEPCLMCVGALVNARVSTLVYGALEPKFGAVSSLLALDTLTLNHRIEVVPGVLAEECRGLLVDFFRSRRD
jgi:tRNA(adenine34) deaminase